MQRENHRSWGTIWQPLAQGQFVAVAGGNQVRRQARRTVQWPSFLDTWRARDEYRQQKRGRDGAQAHLQSPV